MRRSFTALISIGYLCSPALAQVTIVPETPENGFSIMKENIPTLDEAFDHPDIRVFLPTNDGLQELTPADDLTDVDRGEIVFIRNAVWRDTDRAVRSNITIQDVPTPVTAFTLEELPPEEQIPQEE